MKKYYINISNLSNPGFDNEVHHQKCHKLPFKENRKYLGEFSNGIQAVRYAKQIGYKNADGCKLCSPEAHTK